jgi:adenylate cyclase
MSSPITPRRLATILFADVSGYSRMMRADEERTLVDLRAHLAELVGPVIQRFGGRIVKTVGDGVMVEFGSAGRGGALCRRTAAGHVSAQ